MMEEFENTIWNTWSRKINKTKLSTMINNKNNNNKMNNNKLLLIQLGTPQSLPSLIMSIEYHKSCVNIQEGGRLLWTRCYKNSKESQLKPTGQ
jgi:hypothetical protein